MKKIIITIDTEGDNLWCLNNNFDVKTENVLFLERFQILCNKYGFKPVWLTNYEMAMDPRYSEFVSRYAEANMCEVGMHLHAWNNPPYYELPSDDKSEHPYLIEYPLDVMESKIDTLYSTIKSNLGITPVSHRAGRWAMDQNYFDLLIKYGFRVDCSVTPHVSWESCRGQTPGIVGTDYRSCPEEPYYIGSDGGTILECPVTTRISHTPSNLSLSLTSIKRSAKEVLKGRNAWFRPFKNNDKDMEYLIRTCSMDYIMFVIHSSELMPGGSPTFKTAEDIELLYERMARLFKKASENYEGVTLREYAEYFKEKR